MEEKKIGSRIITEMIETLRGLNKSGVLNAPELFESVRSIENRAKKIKSASTTKSKN